MEYHTSGNTNVVSFLSFLKYTGDAKVAVIRSADTAGSMLSTQVKPPLTVGQDRTKGQDQVLCKLKRGTYEYCRVNGPVSKCDVCRHKVGTFSLQILSI